MRLTADRWLRTFLVIFTGQAFSLLGSVAVNFALVWWLTAETGSASVLAYAAIAAMLPQALLGPVAGPLVDRWDRRIIMIVADLFIAATSLVLIALFAAGDPSVPVIVAFIAARSAGAAFHTPASQAAVPMYVPAEHLMRVSGWNYFMNSGTAMAGPVLGAFLMGIAPITVVIATDVAGALIAVTSLLLVRIPHPEQAAESGVSRGGIIAEFKEGWRALLGNRGLAQLTLVLVGVTLLYMPLNALFPLMTREHFGGGAIAASIAELAFGAGMLAGSLGIGVAAAKLSPTRLIAAGIFVLGAAVAFAGILPRTAFPAFAALCVAMGISAPLFGAPTTALFQTLIDPAKLGRVLSLYMTLSMLVAAVGLLLAGPIAEQTGVAVWFAVSGVAMFASGGLVLAPRAIQRLDAEVRAATAAAVVAEAQTADTESSITEEPSLAVSDTPGGDCPPAG